MCTYRYMYSVRALVQDHAKGIVHMYVFLCVRNRGMSSYSTSGLS